MQPDRQIQSSDTTLTRQEFIKKAVKGASLGGGLLLAPQILDKFLVPKAYASGSACAADMATGIGPADFVGKAGQHVYCIFGSGGTQGFGPAPPGLTTGQATNRYGSNDTAVGKDCDAGIQCAGG